MKLKMGKPGFWNGNETHRGPLGPESKDQDELPSRGQLKWSGGILPDPWLVEALRSTPGEASLNDEAGERRRGHSQT